jgi:hypothetical protein
LAISTNSFHLLLSWARVFQFGTFNSFTAYNSLSGAWAKQCLSLAMSVSLSVCSYGTAQLPLDRFS